MSALVKYARKQFGVLEKTLSEYDGSDPDVLHDLRVAIKKIRALLHLADFSTGKKKLKKARKKLKEIFHEAGRLRDRDVLRDLLKKNKIDETWIDARKAKPVSAKEVLLFMKLFRTNLQAVPKLDEKVEDYLQHFNKKDEKEFISDRHGKLIANVTPVHLPDLHENRKILKEMMYVMDVKAKKKSDYKKYDDLQKRIGEWHDKEMLIDMLIKKKNP